MGNIRYRKNQKGAALVEFALVLPLLLLLLLGIIEFSLLLYDKAVITNASREGARAGIVYTMLRPDPNDSSTYADRVNTLTGEIIQVATDYCQDYLITFPGGDSSPAVNLLTSPCEAADDDLTVEVTYNYSFLIFPDILASFFGGSGNDTITLSAQTVMRCE
jgi:Flp pilus assembly protein TadG